MTKRIVDDPVRLQRLLDDPIKLEKYKKAGKMYREGASQRDIAEKLKISFRDIADAIQLEGAGILHNQDSLANAASRGRPKPRSEQDLEIEWLRKLPSDEKEAEASRLFSEGKRPDRVAYMVALPLKEVNQLYLDYLTSKGLYELGNLARTQGDRGIRKLAMIKRVLERRRMLTTDKAEQYVTYAENMVNQGTTLQSLNQQVRDRQHQKAALDNYIKENTPLKKELETIKIEVARLKADKEKISREYPGATVPEIVRLEGQKLIDDNWNLLRTAYNSVLLSAKAIPMYKYALFSEMIDKKIYNRYIYNADRLLQFNNELAGIIMQGAARFREQLVQQLNQLIVQSRQY